jgi:hypothetical protein
LVRFYKLLCFERLMSANKMGFYNPSRTAEINQVRNRHIEVRYLPPQPPSPASGLSLQPAPHRPGNPGFFGFRLCLQTPGLLISGEKRRKVSGHFPKNSRFAETIGGDWFDHDCRPAMALCRGRFGPPPLHGNGDLSAGLLHEGDSCDCRDNFHAKRRTVRKSL